MHSERQVCRRCERLALSGGRRPFAMPGSSAHYAPDLPVRLEHVFLDATVDPKAKTLAGLTSQTVRVVAPGVKRLKLDQLGLKIHEASVGGRKTTFAVDGQALFVDLPSVPSVGDSLVVELKYETKDPGRGIYFVGPDADYPKKRWEVWTQGQDEDTRWWLPTFDYPNQKATSEIVARVPKGFTAVSNGALLSKKDEGASTVFHYKLGTPHVTYLISLVVGEFSEWQDQGPNGVPVPYYVEKGREEDGKRAFGNTPKMIEAYASRIGVPYPYEKYSQVAVQDFIFGGMENTSSTTQTDRTLHDARAHLDFSSDPLVSHELAHQWFGDLLTCRDWSHGWLNEGFATFMERVWIEENLAEYGSREAAFEEAKYYSFMDLKEHLDEDSGKYRRPIVCNTYVEPIDLFDTHLYQKGGLVLNLLRAQLGEQAFWKSINHYVTKHRGGSVETLDLIRAIEDTTGRNMRRFFDQWVFGAGYPDLEITYAWHEDKKLCELVVEQKQTGGKPWVDVEGARTPLFSLDVAIELTTAPGKVTKHVIGLSEARDRVFLPAEAKPLMVRFDPGSTIPKQYKFPRPKEMLVYQLEHDADCMGRIEAARELGQLHERDALEALGKALLNEKFWAVQGEIAGVLGEARSAHARDLLIAGLAVKNAKARRAVVRALSAYRDETVAKAVAGLAEKDASYFVEADAIRTRALALAEKDPAAAEKFVLSQLSKESWLDTIRGAALRVLGELPGAGRGERPEAIAALVEWSKRGKTTDARAAAVDGLGAAAAGATRSERARIFEVFDRVADENDFRLRMRLVAALSRTGLPEAVPILEKIRRLDLDGRVKRDARVAAEAVTVAGSTPESVSALREALSKLEEEQRRLRAMVEGELRSPTHVTEAK